MLSSQVHLSLLTLHQAYHRELLEQMIASGRMPPSAVAATDAPSSRKVRAGSRKAPPSKKPSVKRKKEKKSSSRRRLPKPVAGGLGAMWRKFSSVPESGYSHTVTLTQRVPEYKQCSIRAGACNRAPSKFVHSLFFIIVVHNNCAKPIFNFVHWYYSVPLMLCSVICARLTGRPA